MKILSSLLLILLLIVGVVVWVQKADAYGATSVTLRLFIINTAGATIGNFGLKNGSFRVHADVKDCDPADTKEGLFKNGWIIAIACETGPLHAKGEADCFVEGIDKWGNKQRDEDDDNN